MSFDILPTCNFVISVKSPPFWNNNLAYHYNAKQLCPNVSTTPIGVVDTFGLWLKVMAVYVQISTSKLFNPYWQVRSIREIHSMSVDHSSTAAARNWTEKQE